MSIIYMYHNEDSGTGGGLSAAQLIPLLDQYTYMFGGERAEIMPVDSGYDSNTPQNTYNSLEDAWLAYPNYTWVYLSPYATTHLDEIAHPNDDVVYVVGHDLDGYSDSNLSNGIQVRLRTTTEPLEGHAIPCLISALNDRWSRQWQ